MANTTNFNWETPDDTDLVKDGAAAIRTLGSAIDTSLVDLKGGTTGQILSKTSNTDMDFTWIANDQGDITEITASAPLTGGGSSGAITVGIQDGTTAQKGAVQLEDSTSSTSTTKAATPASVKSAYDLANAAIPKSLVDVAGDLIYATADNTPARLALGTAGQVLTVNSGATAPEWKTASSGATFAGALAYRNDGTGTASAATYTAIDFGAEHLDTDGYHSTSTNKSRLTIPTGKGGYYLFNFSIVLGSLTGGSTFVQLYKNGSSLGSGYYSGSANYGTDNGISGSFVASAVAGDYFQAYLYVDNASGQDYKNGSYFGCTYLGA